VDVKKSPSDIEKPIANALDVDRVVGLCISDGRETMLNGRVFATLLVSVALVVFAGCGWAAGRTDVFVRSGKRVHV
jgi:hypothetical protein